ncbi:MAG: hypothetical protein JAY60_18595 [Candidatus Thiodiazotropha weberae]|nr:hypothetical protein [Candidatus Thiodiazotropha weberae]
MKTDGLEHITLGELQKLSELDTLSMKDSIPKMKEFRDKHGFTDKQALNAFGIAQRIYRE